MNSDHASVVWFRKDLRLSDNPALFHAVKAEKVIPLYIWNSEEEPALGGASKFWLHHSLLKLQESLEQKGSPLIIRQGEPLEILQEILTTTSAKTLHWNRRYEPEVVDQDEEIEQSLKEAGYGIQTYKSYLLAEPTEIQNLKGLAFQVFTPFWKHCLKKIQPGSPLPEPISIRNAGVEIRSDTVDDLQLLPKINWTKGISSNWEMGEKAAQQKLQDFLSHAARGYSRNRDYPAITGTSRLSPHLHVGEITPRQIWNAFEESGMEEWKSSQYIAEIGWREFGYHLLHAYPHTTHIPLRNQFKSFPWIDNPQHLQAWQQGLTGYPIVDAGMRELWHTGWMHNRVRMIVASFLVKHLLINWTEGAKWFWDTLVDADLASNTQGWQWTAGCGADAAPYFRIFNPTTQGAKFDPGGKYIHKWVPELKGLQPPALYEPWNVSKMELAMAGVELGVNYPKPIVDHVEARGRALAAYKTIQS